MQRPLVAIVAIAISFVLFESFGDPNAKYPAGSPGGYTGSPADGKNCKYCHGGQALTVSNWISSNVPASGYVPGTSYTITVTATGSGKKGFEVSPQSPEGALLGTLTPGPGQHLVDTNKAVTHSSAVNTSPANWTFTWIAPASGTGAVTFYGAIVAGLTNIKLCTLVLPESTSGIEENEVAAFSVYPDPINNEIYFNSFIPKPTPLKVSMYSITGELVTVLMDEKVGAGRLSKNFTLSSNIKKGVYLLNFQGNGVSECKKVIIQ